MRNLSPNGPSVNCFFVFLVVGCLSVGNCLAQERADDFLPVASVIEAIKTEIQAAQLDTAEPRLKIEFVDVELAVRTSRQANGGVKVEVPIFPQAALEAGSSMSLGAGSRLGFTLTPDQDTDVSSQERLGLKLATDAIRAGIREALAKPPSMALSRIIYEVDFVLSRSTTGRVSFFFLSVGGNASEQVTSKVAFYFSAARP